MSRALILFGWLMVSFVQVERAFGDLIFSVDFGVSDTPTRASGSPNDVASGFFNFASPTGPIPTPDNFSTLAPIVNSIGPYQVEVGRIGASNGIFYIDAGDMTSAGSLNDLLEDYVTEFGFGVRIRNLSPGNYSMTSYHHLLNATSASTFQVTRSVGALFSPVGTLTTSFGQDPGQISQLTLNFSPDADGTVLFRYGSLVERGMINGFSVSSVPEPSSLALMLGLGALLVVGRNLLPAIRVCSSIV